MDRVLFQIVYTHNNRDEEADRGNDGKATSESGLVFN